MHSANTATIGDGFTGFYIQISFVASLATLATIITQHYGHNKIRPFTRRAEREDYQV